MNKKTALDILKKCDNTKILTNICISYVYDINGLCEKSEKLLKRLLKNLDIGNCSISEKAFILFEMAEHRRISKRADIFTENIEIIKAIGKEFCMCWKKNNEDIFGLNEDRINTVTLGIIYGALLAANNYLKDENISLQIKDIKNFAYQNNTKEGTLMNGSKNKDVSIDILLSAIPFGLFSPEDLVLVEAVKQMERELRIGTGIRRNKLVKEADVLSTLIMSWYFSEKGDYEKARYYLKYADSKEYKRIYEYCVYLIIINKLESCKEIGDNFIIHKPYGNCNRYEPAVEERFPKKPHEGDKITINAVTWPINQNMNVYLKYKKDGINEGEILGKLVQKQDKCCWQWEIGPFKKYTKIDYQIFFENSEICRSKEFSFEVIGKNALEVVKGINKKDNYLYITALDKEGKERYLKLEIKEHGDLKINFLNREQSWKNQNIQEIEIKEESKFISYSLNSVFSIKIIIKPFSIILYKKKNRILETSGNEWFTWYEDREGNIEEISLNFSAVPEENFYGFGERYNSINQRGNLVDVYVYNQYKEQGIKTYMPVPYFISSEGYGVFVDKNSYMVFDMCKTEKDKYSITIEDSSVDLNILIGKPGEIIKKFCSISGLPVMIPKWSFGPWMSSNNWDSDLEVRKQVELTKKYDIPATVLVIEAWSDEATYYIFNDAVYEENDGSSGLEYEDFKFPKWGRWPDPKGLVDYLHENNLKCILWQIPIMKYMNGIHHLQKDIDEEYMIEKGYCVKKEDDTPYRMPEGWFKDSLLMDFSNEEGSEWWFKKRKYLIDELNIDGFKTDGGEFVFGNNIKFSDGKTGKELRNLYPNDYIEAYYNFTNKGKDSTGITFSRAGFTGAQKFPAHWAGDERSNFNAFRRSIIAGLNSSLSGIIFWGWDLGGFSGEIPTAELFIRAAQMAAFCPIMQYHAESKAEFNQDRTPWNIYERTGDEKALSLYRYYANLRMNLIPYIYNEALNCSKVGKPLMKPLLVEYPKDKECLNIQDEYLFGESLLIAPVVYEGHLSRIVYLPEGQWIDFWTDKLFRGGIQITAEAPLDKIPVYVKENSIIPVNLNDSFEIGTSISCRLDKYEKLCFKVYGCDIKEYEFKDDLGNTVVFKKDEQDIININITGDIEEFYLIFNEEVHSCEYLNIKNFKLEKLDGNKIFKLTKFQLNGNLQ